MDTTRNGWPVGPAQLTTVRVAGCNDTGDTCAGDVTVVLQSFAEAFHAQVEPLVTINGFRSAAKNAEVNGDKNSNHLSGTALDLNGGTHPYEANLPKHQRGDAYRSGFTADQVSRVRALLAGFDGVVKWGLDFNLGHRDAMHFEIKGSAAAVAGVAAAVRGAGTPAAPAGPEPPAPDEEDETMIDAFRALELAYRVECGRDPTIECLYPRIVRIVSAPDPRAQLAAEIAAIDASTESNRFEIRKLYKDLLGRPGSVAEWDGHIAAAGGAPDVKLTAEQVERIRAGIAASDEAKAHAKK